MTVAGGQPPVGGVSRRSAGPPARRVFLLVAFVGLLAAGTIPASVASAAADPAGKLKKERARLTEMKRKAEKAAVELAETLRREQASRGRVSDLQARLSRQRRLIERIDRRLSDLAGQMDRAEQEVRALDEEQGRARRAAQAVAARAFLGTRERPGALADGSRRERLRHLVRRVLVAELDRYGRLSLDREEKESILSGIERRIEDSERRISDQKRLGEKLLSQEEAERRRLQEIEKRKKDKQGELRSLKARIARMEALVTRIERATREKERRGKEPRKQGPTRFAGLPGGLVPPLDGKVVARFGKQRDPVFDVTVENRGVDIEAASGAGVRAVGRGEVVFVGGVSGFGKVLILQHGSGLFSVYGRADAFSPKQGHEVAAGEVIGRLPANPEGKSVLYLELRAGGVAIDPMSVIRLSP